MTAPVTSGPVALGILDPTSPLSGRGIAAGETAPGFGDALTRAVDHVDAMVTRADDAADGYMLGHHQDVHGTMIALQEADVSLRLAANVRNRAIEAYREIMRMGA
jgi:flagellar hook-basal body complex protein FliE